MSSLPPGSDPWVVRAGRWLTKRRNVLLAPLFTAALLTARPAGPVWLEVVRDLFGVACLIAGTRLRLVAASYHDSTHCAEPITAGPYAWVRHPLYLSNFLLSLGIVLVAGWWPMVAAYVLLFLPVHILIARSEEVHLIRLYGATYEAYRRAVPAVFPWRRFRGIPYGAPNSFKLEQSKEGLKAAGYLAGMAAILALKYGRQWVQLPPLAPLPVGYGIAAAALVLAAVIVRSRLRLNVLRTCNTALVIGCASLLAIHLPGVWPSPPSPVRIQEVHPAETSEVQPAPASLPSPRPEVLLMERKRPRQSFWVRLAEGLSSNLELLGGLGGFGVSASSLFARLYHPEGQGALPGSSSRARQMGVGPEVDGGSNLALLATVKRRF